MFVPYQHGKSLMCSMHRRAIAADPENQLYKDELETLKKAIAGELDDKPL